MAQLKRYNGSGWENVGGSVAPKTSKTTSDTDTYSCTYVNDALKGDLVVDSIRTKNRFYGGLEQGSFLPETGAETSTTTRLRSSYIRLESGTYTISSSNTNYYVVVYVYGTDGSYKSSESITGWQLLPYTFTLTATRNVRIAIRNSTSANILPSDVSNLMIEKNSTNTTYSAYQNLDGYDNYSKCETRIGTWINGKPLYRKVFELTPNIAAATTSATFDINLANVEEVFISPETKVADTSSSGWVYFFPNIHSNTNYIIGGYIAIQQSKLVFNVRKGSGVGFYAIKLTLEYTKTTD